MGIIEQAAKRLEELQQGGVEVPWSAAGLSEERFNEVLGRKGAAVPRAEAPAARGEVTSLPAAAMQRQAGAPGTPAADRAIPSGSRESANRVDIDLGRLARMGYLAPDLVRSDLALEFRQIKRPLLGNAVDRETSKGRNALIMVTSALPGEGKTFCAVNLAMSMAMEVDTSVLLVDADVIRPTVLERLGLPAARGFLDVLTDSRIDLADVMLRTNVPKLSLLPAGTRNDRSTELLASAAMDRMLMELATRYSDRIVILDAPPLLLTTESRVLASAVGQVLIVVDSDNTPTSKVEQAFATVQDCPLVMSVLNKCAEPEHRHGYYGYDYR